MDVFILHLDSDGVEAEELYDELRLLGARVARSAVSTASALPELIPRRLGEHSSVLLFLTEDLASAIAESAVDLRDLPPAVLPLTFGVKRDLREKVKPKIGPLVPTLSRSIRGFSMEVLAVHADREQRIPLRPARSLAEHWESPLFLYRKREGFDGSRDYLIDVTWSAKPIHPAPASTVLGVFRDVMDHLGEKPYRILDFGAGKLRYSLFWLGRNQRVTAVDYPEPFLRPTDEIRAAMTEAEKNPAFDRLVYPSELLDLKGEFDIALLISVMNIVPDPLERLFILWQCNEKLSEGGHLVWFHYYGDLSQMEAVSGDRITDGGCTGQKGRRTFYKNLPKEEAVRLAGIMGFDVVEGPRFEVDKNVACLFRKVRRPVGDVREFARTRSDLLGRKVVFGDSEHERVIADILDADRYPRLGDFLAHALDSTSAGKKDAYRYEHLVHRIIEYVFREHFTGAELDGQYSMAGGRQRVDLKASWSTESALKTILVDEYRIPTSWVPIECKNYSKPLSNTEYGQLVDRCHKRYRKFAMLMGRTIGDREKVTAHCVDRLSSHDYLILVFDDVDLKTLLRFADHEEDHRIVRFVRERIEKLVDRSPS